MPMSRESMLSILADATARHLLRPLDLAFARFIAERDPQTEPRLLLMAAMASRLLGDGHPCLDLQALDGLAAEYEWPAAWLDLLANPASLVSPLLAGTDGVPANAPLVLDRHRLYLRRYWQYECQVAQSILARIHTDAISIGGLRDELQRLFQCDHRWPWHRQNHHRGAPAGPVADTAPTRTTQAITHSAGSAHRQGRCTSEYVHRPANCPAGYGRERACSDSAGSGNLASPAGRASR
jgi:ATP-dependent exoDNAse (exonuclease V) alpha subunit